MSKESTQTTKEQQRLDPASQRFVDAMRQRGQGGADVALNQPGNFFLGPTGESIESMIAPFMNPYQQQVIGGVQGQFDQLRGQAMVDANQRATAQGAFGGSRAAVERGSRLGALDLGETQQIGGLLSSGFQNALGQGLAFSEYNRALRERQAQEPLFRQQMAQDLLNSGLGPTGFDFTNSQTQQGSTLGTALGLAGTIGGAMIGGPAGASIGGQIGSQLGGFNPPQFLPSPGSPSGIGMSAGATGPSGIGMSAGATGPSALSMGYQPPSPFSFGR